MTNKIIIPYTPRAPQVELHNKAKRFNVIVAHRRLGKTIYAINELIKRAIECPLANPQFAYIAPTHAQAKKIAWDYLKNFLRPLGAKFNEAELYATFYGRKIYVTGAMNADRLRGLYLDGCILDEFGDMFPSAWAEVLRPALSDRKGWAIFIGTPKGKNHFHDLYHAQGDYEAAVGDDWYRRILPVSETGIIDPDELESMRQNMSTEQYAQEMECSFQGSLVGAIYASYLTDAEMDGRITNLHYNSHKPVHTFWDLGQSDATAIWFMQEKDGFFDFIDYYECNQADFSHYKGILDSKGYQYGTHYAPHDAANRSWGGSFQDIARKQGVYFRVVTKARISDGIEAMRLRFAKCRFDKERCKVGLKCLENYRYEFDEKKNILKTTPRHDWASHGADAIRYFAIGYNGGTIQNRPTTNTDWIR